MCTVSVIRLPEGGYLFAANRDEHRSRGLAAPPALDTRGGVRFVAPRDRDAGGTWIAVDERGQSLCLLNGDRPAPGVEPPADAPSRGLLVLDLVRLHGGDAIGRELHDRRARGELRFKPFKLIVATPRDGDLELARFEWNGGDLAGSRLAPPAVEISNGLDPERVARHRRHSFAALVARLGSSREEMTEEVVRWHRSHRPEAPAGDLLSICMHHVDVHSVSLTWIEVGAHAATMRYHPGQPCDNAGASEPVVLPVSRIQRRES